MNEIRQIIEDVIIEYGSAAEVLNIFRKHKHKIPPELRKSFAGYERLLILYIERGY